MKTPTWLVKGAHWHAQDSDVVVKEIPEDSLSEDLGEIRTTCGTIPMFLCGFVEDSDENYPSPKLSNGRNSCSRAVRESFLLS